jgi:hypothetical protein
MYSIYTVYKFVRGFETHALYITVKSGVFSIDLSREHDGNVLTVRVSELHDLLRRQPERQIPRKVSNLKKLKLF